MITPVSALLDRKSRVAVLTDPDRAQAVARLLGAGMPADDVEFALNCNSSVIRSLRVRPPFLRLARFPGFKSEPWQVRSLPRNERGLLLYRPPRTPRGIAREREKLAGHLSGEIARWLRALELSDAERRLVIEEARLLLAGSPLNPAGEYVFDTDRAVAELLRIWRPEASDAIGRNFTLLLGAWLASWIRFWISLPPIWDRALDLAFEEFELESEAA